MTSLFTLIVLVLIALGIRKLFRAAVANPDATHFVVGAARKLLKR